MPPKKPVAKPRAGLRRGAAAAAAAEAGSTGGVPATTAEPVISSSSSSSSSAAAASTSKETKPIPPPRGRLDSLSSSAAARAPAGGLLSRRPPKLKFQPKPIQRRTKEERDMLEAKYKVEQANAVASQDGPPAHHRPPGTRSTRGARGGGGRGRGGRDGLGWQGGASGPFALGSVITPGRHRAPAERGAGFSASPAVRPVSCGTQRAEPEELEAAAAAAAEKRKAAGATIKSVDYSSSEDSDGPRMDVETIALLYDPNIPSEDEDGNLTNPDLWMSWGTAPPVRVPRREHADRQVLVNTDSSSKKGKAELRAIREKEMTFETDIKIKVESEDDADDGPMFPPSSPEMMMKGKFKVIDSPPEGKGKARKEAMKKKKRGKKEKGKEKHQGANEAAAGGDRSSRHAISTTEEKEEFERIALDQKYSLRILGGDPAVADVEDVKDVKDVKDMKDVKDADGDIDMLATAKLASGNPETEFQIFFFQFPQLLPALVPTATTATATAQEPATAASADAKPEATTLASSKSAGSRVRAGAALKSQLAQLSGAPPQGMVGKLRVHKSGRLSLLWGYTGDGKGQEGGGGEGALEMEVSRGAPCEFLQEMVVIKQQSPYGEGDVDDQGNVKGVAYSMGRVKSKYVVSPDFLALINAGTTTSTTPPSRSTARRRPKGKGKAE